VAVLVDQQGIPAAGAVCATPTDITTAVAGVRQAGGTGVGDADRFAIGSLTKSFTATLAAMLVEDGAIAWTSTIGAVFPELVDSIRPEYAAVTLRDLLAHRGRTYEPASLTEFPTLTGTATAQRAQFVAWDVQQAPTTPAGQTAYSNAGYVIAGAMLERVSGQSWESLITTRLAQPLAMAVTFGVPGASSDEPQGHRYTGGQWVAADPVQLDSVFPVGIYPAGGVKIGMQDLGRYLQLHLLALRGDAGLILSTTAARTLHTVVQDQLALGWIVLPRGTGHVDFHNGSDGETYYAEMALSESGGVACAVATSAYSSSVAYALDLQLDRLIP
jgi:CubicO group peptidase (beta-lactamase class C family)